MPSSTVSLPFLPRPAAMAFGRLAAIASRWPTLFFDVLRKQQAPGSLRRAIALVLTGRPDGQLPQFNPAEEILLGAAIAQRGFNVTLEVSSSIMLGYVPTPDNATPQALGLLPQDFVRWATNDVQGCVSIAALERYVRDVDPIRYRRILASMQAPEPNEEQLLGMEKVLCDARVIKNAHRIWQQLDPETRDTLLALGYRVPDPWRVYVAGGDANSDTVRALTLAAYAVEDAEDYFSQRSPTGDAMPPMVLWRLGRLDAFRPPDSVQSAFQGNTESGFVLPETLLSRIALCKAVAQNPHNTALTRRLQDVMRFMGDQRVAQQAVRWMTNYAPDPAQIAPAFEQPQRRTGALGWGRSVLVPDDLWLNILVGYRGAFCGTGWSPLMAFKAPAPRQAPAQVAPARGGYQPPWVPTRTPPRQPPPRRPPPTKVPPTKVPPIKVPVYTPTIKVPGETPTVTPVPIPHNAATPTPSRTTPISNASKVTKLLQKQASDMARAQAGAAAAAKARADAAVRQQQANAAARQQAANAAAKKQLADTGAMWARNQELQQQIQLHPSGAVVTPVNQPVTVHPSRAQAALANSAMQPTTTQVDRMVQAVINNASRVVPNLSNAAMQPVQNLSNAAMRSSAPTSCPSGTIAAMSGGKLTCRPIGVAPAAPTPASYSGGGGYTAPSYAGKVSTPGSARSGGGGSSYVSYSGGSDLAGPPTTGCGCGGDEDY